MQRANSVAAAFAMAALVLTARPARAVPPDGQFIYTPAPGGAVSLQWDSLGLLMSNVASQEVYVDDLTGASPLICDGAALINPGYTARVCTYSKYAMAGDVPGVIPGQLLPGWRVYFQTPNPSFRGIPIFQSPSFTPASSIDESRDDCANPQPDGWCTNWGPDPNVRPAPLAPPTPVPLPAIAAPPTPQPSPTPVPTPALFYPAKPPQPSPVPSVRVHPRLTALKIATARTDLYQIQIASWNSAVQQMEQLIGDPSVAPMMKPQTRSLIGALVALIGSLRAEQLDFKLRMAAFGETPAQLRSRSVAMQSAARRVSWMIRRVQAMPSYRRALSAALHSPAPVRIAAPGAARATPHRVVTRPAPAVQDESACSDVVRTAIVQARQAIATARQQGADTSQAEQALEKLEALCPGS